MQINKGFKYRLFPTKEQKALLKHHFFIYNQAYNICLNLQQEQYNTNKTLEKSQRQWSSSSALDTKIKYHLKQRDLSFSSVVAQQSRINAQKALKSALTLKDRGFPSFKNSKIAKQSFNWNNQGYSIKDCNKRFKILRLMRQDFKVRWSRDLPKDCTIKQITFSCLNERYFVSFSVEYHRDITPLKTLSHQDKAIGLDLNIHDIALSDGTLIPTHSKTFNLAKYNLAFKRLQRKQSRRVLKSKQTKTKLGRNFYKCQNSLNAIFTKSKHKKEDRYHKITSGLSNKFELVAVENLQVKNMTKRAKLRNVKQKSGLNRSILNTSFYQIIKFLEYKQQHNGKLFVKVPPQYTSKTCHHCGNINRQLKLNHREYCCPVCEYTEHRDINAAKNILRAGLKSLGLGISLADSKQQSLSSSETLVSVS
ncbi:IS200/IS605 family element transposase accessory protein TnpB [Helicobacter suis]|uniref:RNA-guided endonuclease InsQ/TnpB family protein n=1 Tax=Helicobacter suis TaxID=104628 RepID=UPI0015968C32|nr:RNA-guided endonuclease TnpB family protein [Helicobacter suis]BCD47246.1 IS200/IS605 family element transposase accessory protein TnpB [Helicobacter suis]BCD49262.1 IS200/IS605 family element transposase accessory protein TnpB [Helicobacter suis]BCD49493.1 IS200/IS605 family element transposase accessory protein TnpB [Helicobacter suis]BCD49773.1 IS200/IS605 family element transposase accessory protein TnpB [Helicobacter suis]BCD50320.1 IS200/IS605 family element transposase accessory prot